MSQNFGIKTRKAIILNAFLFLYNIIFWPQGTMIYKTVVIFSVMIAMRFVYSYKFGGTMKIIR